MEISECQCVSVVLSVSRCVKANVDRKYNSNGIGKHSMTRYVVNEVILIKLSVL